MNILLATYSYYPYNWGGSEVYVSGLANFLHTQGHEVTIIAGMPPHAYEEHPIFYQDDNLKTIVYYIQSIRIIGVVIMDRTTTSIYKKFSEKLVQSWQLTFQKEKEKKWDILHMHANTAAIGESLIKGIKLHSEAIKVIASYHLPVSCVKGTLLFANSMKECMVKPTINICAACFISSKQNWPLSFTKKIVAFMPAPGYEKLPTAIRTKFLVKQFFSSFNSFNREIDQWHVFSKQIKSILQLNGVKEKRMLLLRHGVNPFFFANGEDALLSRKEQPIIIFLYAARFDKVKGFYTLLKAWCTLPETKGRQLWIIGDKQTDDDGISKFIDTASIRSDIKWLGAKSQEELAMVMKKVHCTIIPSEWVEIGPLVFHEAIAAGSDVIASDIGGCKELAELYKNKSRLFETANVNSLATTILQFKYSGTTAIPKTQLQNYQMVFQSYCEALNN